MQNKGDKIKGIIGTIVYHALILAALLFFGLTTPLPLPGEEGVEVNLGNSDFGSGSIQQSIPEEVPQTPEQKDEVIEEEVIEEEVVELPPEKPAIIEEIVEEEVIQQEVEEAPAIIKPEEKKKEEVKVEEKPIEKEPEPVVNPNALYKKKSKPVEEVVEKKPDPVVNPNALYKKTANSNSRGTNQGVTTGAGDQGQVHGTPESVNYDGLGGEGEGISYSLAGRGAKILPKPSYTSPEQGRVVVSIWVNRQGIVTRAVEGAKGTNISDLNLRKLARDAAMRAKFSEDPNAPDLQKGTITYNFIRIN
jgi:colicin import membrane protein